MAPDLYPSGIKQLDDTLHGGLSRPSNFLLIGSPMSNKAQLGMLLLNGGLKREEAAIYISTSNSAEEIRAKWIKHGFESKWEQNGKVKFVDCYSKMLGVNAPDTPSIRRVPSVLDYNKLTVAVNEWCNNYRLNEVSVRVMLDSLSSFLIYSSLQTVMRFLHIFFGQLRKQNVLGFFLVEEGAHEAITLNQLKTFADGALVLENDLLRLEGQFRKSTQVQIDSLTKEAQAATT